MMMVMMKRHLVQQRRVQIEFRDQGRYYLIDRQDLLLTLAPSPGPIIERWGYPNIKKKFNLGLSHLLGGKIMRVLYLNRRMNTIGMSELLEFAECFRHYEFHCMIRATGRYIEVLIQDFYIAYKGKMQR